MGNLSLYIMAPNSMMAILLGMALGGMLATGLRAAAILVLGSWLFGVQFQVVSFMQLFIVFLLTMVALYGMGMMSASLFLLFSREAWHLANLAQEPIYLVSGFYFPIKSFSFWVAAAASIIPLTLGLDAIRQLVFPSGATLGFLTVAIEILALLVMSVLFASLQSGSLVIFDKVLGFLNKFFAMPAPRESYLFGKILFDHLDQ